MPTTRRAPLLALAPLAAFVCACTTPGAGAQIDLRVDAREIHRSLVHARIDMPAEPGPNHIHYVEWVPGNHNPSGPIWNVVDFYARDAEGNALEWDRDPRDPFRIAVHAPDGADSITIEHTYIANQSWANSRSTDTYGRPGYGGLNWNSVMFYPEGADKDELVVDAALVLPEGWAVRSPMPIEVESRGVFDFEPVSLARLVDSPVIFGDAERVRTYTLPVESEATFYFHGAAPAPEHLELPESRREQLARVIEQTHKVFGPYPHEAYHFLILLGDDLPGFGVEHNTSTFIDMSTSEWRTADEPGASSMGVVPHEYIHVWSGKLRTPEGLLGRDYHTDGDPGLLWVYEGLTSYYDNIVSARAGLTDEDDYRRGLLRSLVRYGRQSGRAWRSVEDTARAQRHLRQRHDLWTGRIRRQDYYGEGALFWMFADATIRRGTGGQKSLDDWARDFFGVEWIDWGTPVVYTRRDIVNSLETVYPGADWSALIERYIESPGSTITSDLPPLLGWRVVESDEPDDDARAGELLASTLGLGLARDGEVTSLVAGAPADRAGLAEGMTVLAVNDHAYSPDAMREAIEASPRRGGLTLLVEWNERVRSYEIDYAQGPRYHRLERVESDPDLLDDILQAK